MPNPAGLAQRIGAGEIAGRNVAAEFAALQQIFAQPEHTSRLLTDPLLLAKNRYGNVPVYADNLACLKLGPLSPAAYFNAGVVPSLPLNSAAPFLIASEAPRPAQFPSFFRLLWGLRVSLIVVLVEPGEVPKKCDQYWPGAGRCFGIEGFTLTSDQTAVYGELAFAQLTLTPDSKQPHALSLVHFTAWADHSVPAPAHFPALLALCQKMLALSEAGRGPILAHCSAGIGRTGTLMAAFFLYRELVEASRGGRPFAFSLFETVRHIREHRYWAIGEMQYQFLYDFAVFLALAYP